MNTNDTRERLVDAAVNVFSEKGFYNARVDAIAAEAGVAKGSLYYYFKGKDDLFATLVAEGLAMILDEVDRNLGDSDDPLVSLRKLIHNHIEVHLKFPGITRIILFELGTGGHGNLWKQLEQQRQTYLATVEKIISCGQRTGRFRSGNPSQLAATMIAMLDGIVASGLQQREHLIDWKQVIPIAGSILSTGLISRS